MSNAYEYFLCDVCRCYLINGWGSPNRAFRVEGRNGKWLCVDCDPMGCAECGIYNCDCKETSQ